MAKPYRGGVYIMSDEAGNQKVGHAADVDARRRALQSKRGCKLTVRYFRRLPVGRVRLVEQLAHRTLADYHMGNEWFAVTAAEARYAVEIAVESYEHMGTWGTSKKYPRIEPSSRIPARSFTQKVREERVVAEFMARRMGKSPFEIPSDYVRAITQRFPLLSRKLAAAEDLQWWPPIPPDDH